MEERAAHTVRRIDLLALQSVAKHCMHWQSLSRDEAMNLVIERLEADLLVPLFFCVLSMEIKELPILGPEPLDSASQFVLTRELIVHTLRRDWQRREAGEPLPIWDSSWQGIAMRQTDAIRLFKHPPQSNPRRPPQQQAWQEEEILLKFIEWGIDPRAIPLAPPGKRCPLKQKLRDAFGWTPVQVNKALGRVRAHYRDKHV